MGASQGKRFYNPLLGRWLSPDPLEIHVPGEADANLYAYVSGRALQSVDPMGLRETAPNEEPGMGGTSANGEETNPAFYQDAPDQLGFDPTSPDSARAAGTAMGAMASAVPGIGAVGIANAMEDLRGKLDDEVYNAWL